MHTLRNSFPSIASKCSQRNCSFHNSFHNPYSACKGGATFGTSVSLPCMHTGIEAAQRSSAPDRTAHNSAVTADTDRDQRSGRAPRRSRTHRTHRAHRNAHTAHTARTAHTAMHIPHTPALKNPDSCTAPQTAHTESPIAHNALNAHTAQCTHADSRTAPFRTENHTHRLRFKKFSDVQRSHGTRREQDRSSIEVSTVQHCSGYLNQIAITLNPAHCPVPSLPSQSVSTAAIKPGEQPEVGPS